MDNQDIPVLLDLGDETVQTTQHEQGQNETEITSVTNVLDSFDPFQSVLGESKSDGETLVPTSAPADPFDPLCPIAMADDTKVNGTNFEDQFADLVGDLGDTNEKQVFANNVANEDEQQPIQSQMGQDGDSSGPPSTDGGAPRLEDTLADYKPPKRVEKKEERQSSGPTVNIIPDKTDKTPAVKLNLGGAGANNMCKQCNKRVYEMEKMMADKDIYHKICFKCTHCKRILSLGNFAAIDGHPYCKPHFIELFKKKGRYDMNSAKHRNDV